MNLSLFNKSILEEKATQKGEREFIYFLFTKPIQRCLIYSAVYYSHL